MLGDHNAITDPDCTSAGICGSKKITRQITSRDQIILHEKYLFYGSTGIKFFLNIQSVFLIYIYQTSISGQKILAKYQNYQ